MQKIREKVPRQRTTTRGKRKPGESISGRRKTGGGRRRRQPISGRRKTVPPKGSPNGGQVGTRGKVSMEAWAFPVRTTTTATVLPVPAFAPQKFHPLPQHTRIKKFQVGSAGIGAIIALTMPTCQDPGGVSGKAIGVSSSRAAMSCGGVDGQPVQMVDRLPR